MTTLTLLIRIYNTHQLKQIDNILGGLFEGLAVGVTVPGTVAGRWVQIELSGEDEEIAKSLLSREVGFCPTSIEGIKKFSSLKGYVINSEKSVEKLLLDIGVFQPKLVQASLSLNRLQNQLVYGKKLSLKKICELWGISENLPLNIKVINVDTDEEQIEGELQPTQINRLIRWRDSLLDRLLVTGASLYEINMVIEQEQLSRDIIEIESLGMFEHALVCKLGTDGAGLISRVGRRLRKAKITVFNPKKVLALTDTVQKTDSTPSTKLD